MCDYRINDRVDNLCAAQKEFKAEVNASLGRCSDDIKKLQHQIDTIREKQQVVNNASR